MWPLNEAIKLAQEDRKITFKVFLGHSNFIQYPIGLTVDANFVHAGCDVF